VPPFNVPSIMRSSRAKGVSADRLKRFFRTFRERGWDGCWRGEPAAKRFARNSVAALPATVLQRAVCASRSHGLKAISSYGWDCYSGTLLTGLRKPMQDALAKQREPAWAVHHLLYQFKGLLQNP
jgi:hypothetical protein